MSAALVGLVALPALASALVAAMAPRTSVLFARRIALAVTGLCTLLLLLLLPHAGSGLSVAIEWLPGTGTMVLGSGITGFYAALATTASAFLALLGRKPVSLSAATALLALAASVIAFLAEHFVLRYVALEMVALCVALAPVIERRSADTDDVRSGPRLSRLVYLVLRLGDAGLLAAILILASAGGTLRIDHALEAGQALGATRLNWVAAGFVLAVWIKLGGWPLHLWSQVGGWLSFGSHAWLYATVMPNLGLYLLYRVTPLLTLAGPVQTATMWIGAAGAVVSMFIALTQADRRAALVYVGAGYGGVALFAAASGLKWVVWLSLLIATPVRLLLFLVTDAAQRAVSAAQRRTLAGLLALGGLCGVAFGALTTWWARQSGAPLDVLFVAEIAVALLGLWVVRAAQRLAHTATGPSEPGVWPWVQWLPMLALALAVLVGAVFWEPFLRFLSTASYAAWPALPRLVDLAGYVATRPALWIVALLSGAVWQLRRQAKLEPLEALDQAYDLEEGLARAARILRAVVEVGIQEQIIGLAVRAVVGGARLARRVIEQDVLEGSTTRLTRTIVLSGHVAYRVLEQEGLEGILRRTVQAILQLSQQAQRWHRGRLRRSLTWAAISLALAMLALLGLGW